MDSSASAKLQRSKLEVSGCRLGEATWIWYRRATRWNVRTSCYCHKREKDSSNSLSQSG
uniref:Uncharacterized protein n=1 Tax=Arundo donax TaxID=35708 RepID=A0A0A9C792_ARUDO